MSELDCEFFQFFSNETNNKGLLVLREKLIEFKNKGMDQKTMLELFEKLRQTSDSDTEDTLLELMDFVYGYCNPTLLIFEK
jgi:hypothetical protein